ncbi:MAG: prepilin-type N-terminal cleavage/methylation domain-containing protein [Patescibacteria group bacterium]
MHNRKGFTLVELLVAAALFATVMAVTVNLFILALRKPLTGIDTQHVQEEMNFFLETLASQMTSAEISYSSYTIIPLVNPVNDLYLAVSDTGGVVTYRYFLMGGQVIRKNVATDIDTPITTSVHNDVVIDALSFYIYPQTNPTDPTLNINYQPSVMILITGHSVKDASQIYKLQTFLTTRQYAR